MADYPVIITRRRTTRLSIRVTKDGEVRVSAPRLIPKRVINEFVASHQEWIEKALERVGRRQRGREAFYAQLDVSTPALRKAAAARLSAIVVPMVERHAEALAVEFAGGRADATGDIRRPASDYIPATGIGAARTGATSDPAYAPPRAEGSPAATPTGVAPATCTIAASSVTPAAISYRCTKTRWGSCNPKTRHINFSTYLLLLPDWCIEHVVVHELCHLLVPDHGPRFYALMDRHFPRWKEARRHTRRLVSGQ